MKNRTRLSLRLECLEARDVPAVVVVNPTTARYTDVDGDQVTIKVTRGVFTAANFATVAVGSGDQLQTIDLSAGGFDGANLTVSVRRAPGGDRVANVGFVNSADHDLGNVTIAGDIGRIVAGDTNRTTPGLKRLSVQSIGNFGLETQAPGGDYLTVIDGPLGALLVKGDIKHALVYAQGVNGNIGSVSVGGSIIGSPNPASAYQGEIYSDGNMGPVRIGGDIHGNAGFNAGLIGTSGNIASVTIGGSLIGGAGERSGAIYATGNIGQVRIGQGVAGGAGLSSGRIESDSSLAGVTIGGSITGGPGEKSGTISAVINAKQVTIGGDVRGGAGPESGKISSGGNLSGVKIGGSLVGGTGNESGLIRSDSQLGQVSVNHDVRGGSGNISGSITSAAKLASVKIGGSLIGGSVDRSGMIISSADIGPVNITGSVLGGQANGGDLYDSGTIQGRRIASVTIGGSIDAGGQLGGFRLRCGSVHAELDIGAINVKGSLIGLPFSPVVITATGQPVPTATQDIAVKSLTVGGRVENASIQIGYTKDSIGLNADAQIGAVKVGGDWVGSNLFVGTSSGIDGWHGTADDVALAGDLGAGPVKNDTPVSRIASIDIRGQVYGTLDSFSAADVLGFVAQQIGSLKVGGQRYGLTAGPGNDTASLTLAKDVNAIEVAV